MPEEVVTMPKASVERLQKIAMAARRLLALIDEPMTPRNRRMDAQAALREALAPVETPNA